MSQLAFSERTAREDVKASCIRGGPGSGCDAHFRKSCDAHFRKPGSRFGAKRRQTALIGRQDRSLRCSARSRLMEANEYCSDFHCVSPIDCTLHNASGAFLTAGHQFGCRRSAWVRSNRHDCCRVSAWSHCFQVVYRGIRRICADRGLLKGPSSRDPACTISRFPEIVKSRKPYRRGRLRSS